MDPGKSRTELALHPRLSHGGQIKSMGEGRWRLEIPAGPGGHYRLAQVEDYTGLRRHEFPWKSPAHGALDYGTTHLHFLSDLGALLERCLPCPMPPGSFLLRHPITCHFETIFLHKDRLPLPSSRPRFPRLCWPLQDWRCRWLSFLQQRACSAV